VVLIAVVEQRTLQAYFWRELKYAHSKDEVWKTWPTSRTLNDFALSRAEPLIISIVDDFFGQLWQPFRPLQQKVIESVRAAQLQFDALKDALEAYNRTTIVGADFVRYCYYHYYY